MSKPRWVNGRLDLGGLGRLSIMGARRFWWWMLTADGCERNPSSRFFSTEAAAQRAAVRWLRAALRQAAKKMGGE